MNGFLRTLLWVIIIRISPLSLMLIGFCRAHTSVRALVRIVAFCAILLQHSPMKLLCHSVGPVLFLSGLCCLVITSYMSPSSNKE